MKTQGNKVSGDWIEVILGIARFFLEHSDINLNGSERTVSVKYRGPNGWQMSFETLRDPYCQNEEMLLGGGTDGRAFAPPF